MLQKRWHIPEVDPHSVDTLQAALGIARPICEILVRRSIRTFEQARSFFRPDMSALHDPFLMKGMKEAVERVLGAVTKQQKICIFGDYDVDGTTSVSLLYDFFARYLCGKEQLFFYLPDRNREGYGLSREGVVFAREHQCQLMVLVDCGIKDVELVNLANSWGIDIIIIDHHITGESVPDACAILNPKQEGCTYPYKELSACGIAYKFFSAIKEKMLLNGIQEDQYLDWTTLSIASDIVPMTGENRVMSALGLKKIQSAPSAPVKLFISALDMGEKSISISDLVFKIGPKINAAGRMTHASEVVRLFTSEVQDEQERQLRKLFDDNTERQAIDQHMTQEIFDMLDEELAVRECRSIVVYKPHWHKGIIGIVASRIVERYYKPTIVMTLSEDGKLAGSARSVHGFDIYKAIERAGAYLTQFGGHAFAAGMTLHQDMLPGFKKAFEKSVSENITEDSLTPLLNVDAEINLEHITPVFAGIIAQFEPCGPQNDNPVFLIRNLVDSGSSRVVKELHAQLFLKHTSHNSPSMKGIGFNLGSWVEYLKSGRSIDILCHVEQNSWNGAAYTGLRILDIKPSYN